MENQNKLSIPLMIVVFFIGIVIGYAGHDPKTIEKIEYKDRPVEKIVYQDRIVEVTVTVTPPPTPSPTPVATAAPVISDFTVKYFEPSRDNPTKIIELTNHRANPDTLSLHKGDTVLIKITDSSLQSPLTLIFNNTYTQKLGTSGAAIVTLNNLGTYTYTEVTGTGNSAGVKIVTGGGGLSGWQYQVPITISGSTSWAAAQQNYQVAVDPQIYNNTGLVGSWHFSEGTGTTTADLSGNNNTGTWAGAGTHWTTSGKFGNGGQFNGTNDYIDAGSGANLSITGALTVELWMKSNTAKLAFLAGKYDNTFAGSSYGIQGQADGKIDFYTCNGVNATDSLISITNVYDNQWHHIVGVWNGTTKYIYIDGKLENSLAWNTVGAALATKLYFGSSQYTTYGYYNGAIDEPRVYNRALSADEITQQYNNGTPKVRHDYQDIRFTNAAGTELPYWQETDSKFWVKADNIPNTTAGTTLNMYYGNPAATFGGANANSGASTFIDFSDFNDLSGWTQQLGTWTVSGGVLHTAQTVEQANALRRDTPLPPPPYILSYRHKVVNEKSTGARGLLAEANNPIVGSTSVMWVANTYSNLFYCSVDADWASVAYNSAPNTWYIGDLQIKSGANIATIYSDNRASLLASKTNTANSAGTGHYFGFVMYASDSDMDVDWIFVRKYASPEPVVFMGQNEGSYTVGADTFSRKKPINISGSASWAAAQANYQVAVDPQIYNNTGLVGSWHFSEGTGTTTADMSGNNNTGTWAGAGTHWTTSGKFGNGAQFNGSNDYVSIPDSPYWNLSGSWSVAFWTNPTDLTQRVYYGRSADNALNGGENYLYYTTASPVGLSWGPINLEWKTGVTLIANQWQYVTMVYNAGAGMAYCYVDGQPRASVAVTSVGSSSGPLKIAANYNVNYFSGLMDEFCIYNRALSADEIAQRYNNGSPKVRHDYQDIRFTNASGTELPYWQETDSKFWVKADNIPNTTAGTTLNMYYGNPTATFAPDPNAAGATANTGKYTFEFFDDFEDGVKTGWTENGGTWVEGGGVLKQTLTTDDEMQIYKTISSGTYLVEADVRPDAFGVGKDIGLVIRTNGLSTASEPHGHAFTIASTTVTQVTGLDQWVNWVGAMAPGFSFTAGTWYNFKMYAPLDGNTDMKGKAWLKGTAEPGWQVSATMSSQTGKNVGIHGSSHSGTATTASFDNFRVRKYASPEPMVSALQEAVPNTIFTSRVLDTGVGGAQSFGKLEWTANIPAQCGANAVKFQLASASADTGPWTYYGPTSTSDYYTTSGSQINSVHNGQRYIKYKAYLSTADVNYTPTLQEVKIGFASSTSANRVISAESLNSFTIAPSVITVANVEPVSLVAGITGNVNVTFTSINPIPADAKIVVTFPTGFTFNSGGNATVVTGTPTGISGTLTVTPNSNTVTITKSSGGSVDASGAKSFTLTNVKNKDTVGSTGTYALKTTTVTDKTIDEITVITADDITSGGALNHTTTDVQPASLIAGVTGPADVKFTTLNPIPANGQIVVTFPSKFTLDSGGITTTTASTLDGTLTVSRNGQVLTITRSGGTQELAGKAETITLNYIRNYPVSGPTGTYSIQTASNAGVANGLIDQDLLVTSDDIIPATPSGISVGLSNYNSNQTTSLTLNFTAVNPVEVNGKVEIVFDPAFDISLATFNPVTGGNTGATITSTTNSTLVLNLGTEIPAGQAVSLLFGGIKNPAEGMAVADYIVRTRTSEASGGAIIDSGKATGSVIIGMKISAPNGNEKWEAGKQYKIKWNYYGAISEVSLYYSVDGGAYQAVTGGLGLAPSLGELNWTIPATISDNVKVKIVVPGSLPEINDFSDASFYIVPAPSVTFNHPVGADDWVMGTTQTLDWTTNYSASNTVKIEFSSDGLTYAPIKETYGTADDGIVANNLPATVGGTANNTLSWVVPDLADASSSCKIKITVTDNYVTPAADLSFPSNAFSISLAKATLGEIPADPALVAGDTQTITWTTQGTKAAQVKLYYATDYNAAAKTGTWVRIPDASTLITNNGSYSWVIPESINSTTVGLKIEDNDRPAQVFDYSNAAFSVRYPTITLNTFPAVTEPTDYDGVTALVKADAHPITFTTERDFGNKLKLQCVNASDGSLVLEAAIASYTHPNGSIGWAIPPTVVGEGRQIKIVDSTRPIASNLSNTFKVLDKAKYKILRPAANEDTIVREDKYYYSNPPTNTQGITWIPIGERAKQANTANVKLEYVKDNVPGAIIDSTSNDGNFEYWTVTYGLKTNDMKMRISGGTNYDASAISSDSPAFKARGELNVTAPAAAATWNIGSTHSINWNTYGKITAVNLDYWTGSQWLTIVHNLDNIDATDAYIGTNRTYSWVIPNDDAYRCLTGGKIRISAVTPAEASAIYGDSVEVNMNEPVLNVSINLPPSLKWIRGDTQRISLGFDGKLTSPGSLQFAYASKNAAFDPSALPESDWTTFATISTANTYYDWQLPIDFTGTFSAIRVKDINANRPNSKGYSTVFTCIPSPFITVTAPSAVPSWRTGEDRTISWTGMDGVNGGNLKIEYSTDNSTWLAVKDSSNNSAVNLALTGSFIWRIPKDVLAALSSSQTVYLKITDTLRGVTPMSPASVTLSVIPVQISVTSPVAADKWVVDEAKTISFTTTGGEGGASYPVNIQYKHKDDLTWTDLATNYTANANGTTSYSLTAVPTSVGLNQIRIVETYRSTLNCPTCWVPSDEFEIYGRFSGIDTPATDLTVGGSYNAAWTTKGSIPGNQIEIYYYTGTFDLNNASTTKKLADGAVSSLSSPYNWSQVADFVYDDVKFRIRDKRAPDNTTSYKESSAFRIIPVLALTTYPGKTDGESYVVGTTTDIIWQATGALAKVNLQYYDGTNWYDMSRATLDGVTQVNNVSPYKYTWTIPDKISAGAKIRISSPDKPAEVKDTSDYNFKIAGSLDLTQPDGLESWVIGAQRDIKWSVLAGTMAKVKLQYTSDYGAGAIWKDLAGTAGQATLVDNVTPYTYSWTIPDDYSDKARVRVYEENNLSNTSESALNFGIISPLITISQPAGANVGLLSLTVNEPYNINWATEGMNTKLINIKCSYDNKGTWTDIVSNWPNAASGSVSFTPTQTTTTGWIKIEEISNTHPSAIVYSGPFTVLPTPAIEITAPASPWIMGKTYTIQWASTGVVHNNLAIDYTLDGSVDPATWIPVAAGELNDGQYSWTVPDTDDLSNKVYSNATHAKVRVRDATAYSAGKYTVGSTNEFTLGIPTIALVRPVGGEVWAVGDVAPVAWSYQGAVIGPLTLQYDTTGTLNFDSSTAFASNIGKTGEVANSYAYNWTVPVAAIGTNVKAGIKDSQRTNTRDSSPAIFSVIAAPTINISSPANAGDFVIEENMAVNWSVRGLSVGNVNIVCWDDTNLNDILDAGETSYTLASNISRGASDTADAYSGKYTGAYTWSIPQSVTPSTTMKLKISDSAGHVGLSSGHFRVRGGFEFRDETDRTLALAAATDWKANTTHTIKWYNKGEFPQVKLEYATSLDNAIWTAYSSIDSGTWFTNTKDAQNYSSYSWKVPDPHLASYPAEPPEYYWVKLKLTYKDDTTVYAESAAFKIGYYTLIWKVKDYDNLSLIDGLSVRAVNPAGKIYWEVTLDKLGIDPVVATKIYPRRYPYGTVSTFWSKEGYIERADADRVISAGGDIIFLLESRISAQVEHKVWSKFAYDEGTDTLTANTWLEKKGTLILGVDPDLGKPSGANIIISEGSTEIETMTATTPDANGSFWFVRNKATVARGASGGLGLASGKTYFVKVNIWYRDRLYSSGNSFDVSIAQKLKELTETIKEQVSGVQGTILSEGLLTRGAVTTASTNIQNKVTAEVGAVKTETAKILTAAVTTIPAKITTAQEAISTTLTTEVKPHIQSGILNRDTVIKTGDTINIRYRTATGKSPTVSIYNSKNVLKVSSAVMIEAGATGVYEYPVKFIAAWGTGEFTIVCSESTQGTVDAMVISVIRHDIDEIAGQVSAVLGSTSGISGLTGVADTINTQFSLLDKALGTLSEKITSKVAETKSVVSDLESVYNQLVSLSGQIKSLGGATGINLEKLYEVSKDKKNDINYLKNKALELKATMEMNQKMLENAAKKPIVQTWFEFK